MKKLTLIIIAATLLQSQSYAYIGLCDKKNCGSFLGALKGTVEDTSSAFTISLPTILPTVAIAGEDVDYNSPAGKALLIQEAQNVLEGKKSLLLKDDESDKEGGMTAIEKAQILLNGLSEQ